MKNYLSMFSFFFSSLFNIHRILNVIIWPYTIKERNIKSVIVGKKNLLYHIFIYNLFYKM